MRKSDDEIYRNALGAFSVIKPLYFHNEFGYQVQAYSMSPLIITNLADFMENLGIVLAERTSSGQHLFSYIAQDHLGCIYAYSSTPFTVGSQKQWLSDHASAVKCMQRMFELAAPTQENSMRGLYNPKWDKCIFPVFPMGVSVYERLKQYIFGVRMAQINEANETATLGSAYSVSVRRYMDRRLKLISEGDQ